MKKVNPSRLTHRVKLGAMEDQLTPSGIYKPVFVPKLERWCSLFTLSVSQIVQTMGVEQNYSHTLLVRTLQNGLEDCTHAEFKGQVYKIASYHPDADNSPKSFDLIVLKEVKRNG